MNNQHQYAPSIGNTDLKFKGKDEAFEYELGWTMYPFVPGCGNRPGSNAAWMGHMDAKKMKANRRAA